MSYKPPQPIGTRVGTILTLLLLIGIAAFTVWFHWWAPCSWWRGSPITEVPMRCVEELR